MMLLFAAFMTTFVAEIEVVEVAKPMLAAAELPRSHMALEATSLNKTATSTVVSVTAP